MPNQNPYNSLGQSVITSTLAFQKDFDSFFEPVTYSHDGYAADGVWYDSGVPNPDLVASWFSEPTGPFRGGTPSFPPTALILVSRASLSIYDATTSQLLPWMTFLFADDNAFTDNFSGGIVGYLPSGVSWANGLLNVNYTADPGSTSMATTALTIDFTHDNVFLNTCLAD